MNYIKGNFRKKIYSTDKGYIVGIFKIKETNEEKLLDYIGKTITFTGYFDNLNENELYIFYGEIVQHSKYGLQYQVNNYDRLKPEDKDGIVEFLSSDLFPGIGVGIAKKIVNKLGDNALDLIINNVNCLSTIKGINNEKKLMIYNTLINYEDSHKTIVYLTELGFTMRDGLLIYNKYKKNTISQIENDVYQIMFDIEDISFVKIDEVANNLGIKKDDERRIKACIIYIMKNLSFSNGDSYFYKDELYEEIVHFLRFKLELEIFNQYLEELSYEDKIIIDNQKYYLTEMYKNESYVSDTLKYLIKKKKEKEDLLNVLEQLEKINNIEYNEKQKEAIISSLNNNITIITGGPGTGKTTIIKAIVDLYKLKNKLTMDKMLLELALLAPTGRASKRLSESTGFPAYTIHRFLKWNKESDTFAVNEYNKDFSKLIIVDEASMIDINLFNSLLRGLTKNIKLILVGDFNQLPSVGPGQVLKDLIESNKIDTVYLDTLYRQKENSYINMLAYEIKNQNLTNFLETKDDYTFLSCSNESIPSSLSKICEQIKSKKYDLKNFQIMAPMYYGLVGIDNLNLELQEIFNPPSSSKKEVKVGNTIYRENDKILVLVNMPDENIYNGDIGIIKKIIDSKNSESKKTEVVVDFDGNIVTLSLKDFNQIKHGYVISIHKSQGSEFDTVAIILSNSHKRMLYKKLIYTAVTRAKRKLIIIGQADAFSYAVNNNNEYERKTSLKDKLMV